MTNSTVSLVALNDLAVITLTGPDATSFLQSQLTQDVESLGPDQATLAGYCSARGRLFASMVAVQQAEDQSEGWILLAKADAAMAFAQRLRMFVLRAKVDVRISEDGVIGVRVPESANAASSELAVPDPVAAWGVVRRDGQIWIRVPERDDAPDQRWWLLNAAGIDADASDAMLQAWQADDIAAGLPWIQAATQEAFIPQTVNMDLIGGVSFTKGCYPGQEVVARSHYRGTIKRRMAYAQGDAISLEAAGQLAGADTFDAGRPGRPCGRVVNAAVSNGALHVLMEVQLTDVNQADYRLESDDGHSVTVAPLPYPIVPDAPEEGQQAE